jgi:hypothetical protein
MKIYEEAKTKINTSNNNQRDLAQISAYLQALFPDLAEEGTPIQAPTEEAIQIALHSLPSGYFRI